MFSTAMITVFWNLDEEKSLRRTVVERAWHSNTNSLWEDGQTGHDQSYIAHMMQPQPRLVAAICPRLETTHQLPSNFDSHDDVASFDMCRYANRG